MPDLIVFSSTKFGVKEKFLSMSIDSGLLRPRETCMALVRPWFISVGSLAAPMRSAMEELQPESNCDTVKSLRHLIALRGGLGCPSGVGLENDCSGECRLIGSMGSCYSRFDLLIIRRWLTMNTALSIDLEGGPSIGGVCLLICGAMLNGD